MGWFGFKTRAFAFSILSALVLSQSANGQILARCCQQPSCEAPCGDSCTDSSAGAQPDIDTSSVANDFGASSGPETIAPHMLGDYLAVLHQSSQGVVPQSVRNFKFADNQSARPIDRIYSNYSYFNDVGPSGGKATQITQWTMGGEKTILDGQASVGVQVPLYFVDPAFPGGSFSAGTPDRAAFGNISMLFKYAFVQTAQGDVLSGGLGWTIPTGSSTIGGVPTFPGFTSPVRNNGGVQPYLAGIYQLGGGVYLQGFTALDIPIDNSDSMIWMNDLQLGYIARTYNSSGITAVVPVLEVHSNAPSNRTLAGGYGYFSTVNITTGVTLEINRRSTLNLGLVCPIQDNHSFDYEFLAQLNIFGGGKYGFRNY